jgi:hypothetical protein
VTDPTDPTDRPAADLDELLDLEPAAAVVGVPAAQLLAMAEQGVVTPEEGSSGPRFRRAELLAARELGG